MPRKILLREGAAEMTRRGFLGGGCAAAVLAPGFAHAGMAPGAPANVGEIAGKGPLLRFGVASDVHIVKDWGDANSRGLADQERHLERALRWFDSLGADAVVFPGDMAHTGRVSELEALAAVWEKVFPRSVAADGRRVERLLVTGNHEVGQWPGLWDGIPDAELRRIRLDYDRAHLEANWKRIFREDYRLVWRREVKGVTFIGCQYPRPGTWHSPDICAGVRALARDLPADRPFFYVQHAHPAHTCYSVAGAAVRRRGAGHGGNPAAGAAVRGAGACGAAGGARPVPAGRVRRRVARLRLRRAGVCGRTGSAARHCAGGRVRLAGIACRHGRRMPVRRPRAAEGRADRLLGDAAQLLRRVRPGAADGRPDSRLAGQVPLLHGYVGMRIRCGNFCPLPVRCGLVMMGFNRHFSRLTLEMLFLLRLSCDNRLVGRARFLVQFPALQPVWPESGRRGRSRGTRNGRR